VYIDQLVDQCWSIILLYIIILIIVFILLDEVVMSSSQRRIGPYNIGTYGICSSLINGTNLIMTQLINVKLQFNYGFQLFPIIFMLISLLNYNIIYPFFLFDIYISVVIVLLFNTLSIIFLILTAFSGGSKYSILGSIRLVTQLVSFELIYTTLLLILILSYNDVCIIHYWLYGNILFNINWFYIIIYLLLLISILGDCNRTPFDLPEGESEIVAGFITELSSIYFSMILLTEYGNIILLCSLLIILFSCTTISFILYLIIICLIRSSFLRFRYDELMIIAWVIILPFIFILLLILLLILIN